MALDALIATAKPRLLASVRRQATGAPSGQARPSPPTPASTSRRTGSAAEVASCASSPRSRRWTARRRRSPSTRSPPGGPQGDAHARSPEVRALRGCLAPRRAVTPRFHEGSPQPRVRALPARCTVDDELVRAGTHNLSLRLRALRLPNPGSSAGTSSSSSPRGRRQRIEAGARELSPSLVDGPEWRIPARRRRVGPPAPVQSQRSQSRRRLRGPARRPGAGWDGLHPKTIGVLLAGAAGPGVSVSRGEHVPSPRGLGLP